MKIVQEIVAMSWDHDTEQCEWLNQTQLYIERRYNLHPFDFDLRMDGRYAIIRRIKSQIQEYVK